MQMTHSLTLGEDGESAGALAEEDKEGSEELSVVVLVVFMEEIVAVDLAVGVETAGETAVATAADRAAAGVGF